MHDLKIRFLAILISISSHMISILSRTSSILSHMISEEVPRAAPEEGQSIPTREQVTETRPATRVTK